MAAFTDLLGSLMQSGMSRSSTSRATNALGGNAGAGSLTDLVGGLGQLLGGAQPAASSGMGRSATTAAGGAQSRSGTAPANLGGMLGSVLQSLGSNTAAAGGLGALAGALLGGGKKATRGAIGGGSLALLASLAFAALQQAGQKPAPPQALAAMETPQQQAALEDDALLIVKAMINAAKADGHVDEEEVRKIIGKLEENGLSETERTFFISEAKAPLDMQSLINGTAGRPDLAAEIYAASLLAIEVDTDAERRYLQQLATGLKLPQESVAFIEKTLGVS